MPEEVIAASIDNPFPGLRSFGEEEADLFFGRDDQVNELLRKLSLYHFISVVGTSGSGKSSLVRAGLIPAIKNKKMDDHGKSTSWQIKIMHPGTNPILNLAATLFPDKKEITAQTLKESSLGLVQVMRHALQADEKLLLIVDQFEELFRLAGEEENADKEAEHFVKLLIEAAAQKDIPVYIVITLRADFLGDCTRFEGLPEAINNGQYLIPRLNKEEKKETISGPVKFANGKISPVLVQRLLDDVGNNPDQLPILQHAMMRTWDNWKKTGTEIHPMDVPHYAAIGTMQKALNQHADEAWTELNEEERIIAEKIFKCITVKGEDNRGIRRPESIQTISEIIGVSADKIIKVVNVFRRTGRGFIMPSYNIALTEKITIDISHESLMRVWERLENWVDEEAQSAMLYKRITESALLYEQGKSALWRNPELQLALEWKEKNIFNEKWAQQYNIYFKNVSLFLNASVLRQVEENNTVRRRKFYINTGIFVFLVLAAILTIWALNERSTSERHLETAIEEKAKADKQKQIANEKENEARHNSDVAETQRTKAEEERAEAEKQKRIALVKEYEAQLQKKLAEESSVAALNAKKLAEQKGKEAISERDKAEQNRRLAEENEKTASRLHKLSVSHYLAIKSQQLQDATLKSLLAYWAYKLNKDNGGKTYDADIFSALMESITSENKKLETRHNEVKNIIYSTDGSEIISVGSEGQIYLWNVKNGYIPQLIYTAKNQLIKAVAYADANTLAVGFDNGKICLLSTDNGKEKGNLLAHSGSVTALICADNKIISCGDDKYVSVCDEGLKNQVKTFLTEKANCLSAYGTDAIYAGTASGNIYKITKLGNATLSGNTGAKINCVELSKNQKTLCCGLSDGSLIIMDIASGKMQKIKAHSSAITSLSINPDNNSIATGSFDNSVKIFHLSSLSDAPYEIRKHSSYIWSVNFNPDGNHLATGAKDIRILGIRNSELADNIRKNISRNLSRSEWSEYIGDDIVFEELIK